MTADRWKAIESSFHAALDLPESERDGFLESSCSDPDIRAEVRKLLDQITNDSFLEPQALQELRDRAAARRELSEHHRLLAGRLSGTVVADRYRVIRLLGRGGQSIVFLAADQRLGDRPVALKVLDSGSFDNGLQRRFRQEITALARITHPAVVAKAVISCRKRRC